MGVQFSKVLIKNPGWMGHLPQHGPGYEGSVLNMDEQLYLESSHLQLNILTEARKPGLWTSSPHLLNRAFHWLNILHQSCVSYLPLWDPEESARGCGKSPGPGTRIG